LDSLKKYEAIAIGTSAGGLYALFDLLTILPQNYPLPIIVVQHRSKDHNDLLEEILQNRCKIVIKQVEEKEKIRRGHAYFAPPDYHLLIEYDKTFSLSADAQVRYSRPSIDVLFESAAAVYKNTLIGIILTGANSDGAQGITEIKKRNGLTISQDPGEALFPQMPKAAIETGAVTNIYKLAEIKNFLLNLV
jgi:two-component system chemotaxis response regulator CheB